MTIEYFSDPTDLKTVAFRFGLSFILAFLIGLERERQNQPAGLRTHVLISIGSTMFMIISTLIPTLYQGRFLSDPSRIAAQIVTGIGFLGAGAILKIGINIKGLTTAANIWVVASIGMAVGAGFYYAAMMITALTLITLIPLTFLEGFLIKSRQTKKLVLKFGDQKLHLPEVRVILDKYNISITNVNFVESIIKEFTELDIDVKVSTEVEIAALFKELRKLPNVLRVELNQQ
jgi:putative Mg2+ transporter-C (MgtC) family protein